jgi:hypothetical protein
MGDCDHGNYCAACEMEGRACPACATLQATVDSRLAAANPTEQLSKQELVSIIATLRADLARVEGERDGMLCNGTALRGEILGACCPEKNGDDLDPLVEVRRVVADLARVARERDDVLIELSESLSIAKRERDEARVSLAQLAAATERAEKAEAREGELTAELRRLWGVVCDEDAAAIEAHIGLVGAEPAAVCEVHNRRLSSA